MPQSPISPKIDQPRIRSPVGGILDDELPMSDEAVSEMRKYAFASRRAHKPDYGTGHTLRDESSVMVWGGYPTFDANWMEGATRLTEAPFIRMTRIGIPLSEVSERWNLDVAN